MNRPKTIEKMIEVIKKLPGIGPKMAERLSYYIVSKMLQDDVNKLLNSIKEAKLAVKNCTVCYNLTEYNPCVICSDSTRIRNVICVVESPQDLIAVSKVKEYKGLYFVLGGVLSPLDAIGPSDIRIDNFVKRLKNDNNISEVIIATDADSKGEMTAIYLANIVKKMGIKVTRLGCGLPVGGDIEYADERTIYNAITARKEM
ncbi:MAG: recombination mediator RecR [Endomicrobium sp.]|jgi:recombination protein RecR|nr:recombination mediator RecR [Endomicrobium sp.]